MNNILDILLEFQQKHPNIYIGGSVALILQKAIPSREPKDIDIISSQRTHIYNIFEIKNKEQHPIIRRYKHKGLYFELFNNPKAQYIEHNYKNGILKLSPISEVMHWKLKKMAQLESCEKHIKDIQHYLL